MHLLLGSLTSIAGHVKGHIEPDYVITQSKTIPCLPIMSGLVANPPAVLTEMVSTTFVFSAAVSALPTPTSALREVLFNNTVAVLPSLTTITVLGHTGSEQHSSTFCNVQP